MLVLLRTRGRLAAAAGGTVRRLVPRPRAILLLPLALCLVVAAIVFAVRSSPAPSCSGVMQLAATGKHPPSSRLCRNGPAIGLLMGH